MIVILWKIGCQGRIGETEWLGYEGKSEGFVGWSSYYDSTCPEAL